jgi:hypothetical protein
MNRCRINPAKGLPHEPQLPRRRCRRPRPHRRQPRGRQPRDGSAALERRYRRLLACYPRSFRDQNGPEILGVLLAAAPPGQRHPGPAEAAGLFRSGLGMRLRPAAPRQARTAVWLWLAWANGRGHDWARFLFMA